MIINHPMQRMSKYIQMNDHKDVIIDVESLEKAKKNPKNEQSTKRFGISQRRKNEKRERKKRERGNHMMELSAYLTKELEYIEVKYLNFGSCGMVFEVTKQGGEKVAVKASKQAGNNENNETKYHKMAHEKFNHMVVNIENERKAKVGDTEWVFFEMPLMDGDLHELMLNRQTICPFTGDDIAEITKDLMELFVFFNKQGIVYGDLKPENLLYKLRKDGGIEQIKLTDFDLTSNIKQDVIKRCKEPWIKRPFWFGTHLTSPYITNQDAYDNGRATPELFEFLSAGIKIEESIDYANLGNLLTCLVDWKYKITNKWNDLNYFKHFRKETNWDKFHSSMEEKEVSKELRIMIEAFFPKYVRENNWSFDVECYRRMNWTTLKRTIDEERKKMIAKWLNKSMYLENWKKHCRQLFQQLSLSLLGFS